MSANVLLMALGTWPVGDYSRDLTNGRSISVATSTKNGYGCASWEEMVRLWLFHSAELALVAAGDNPARQVTAIHIIARWIGLDRVSRTFAPGYWLVAAVATFTSIRRGTSRETSPAGGSSGAGRLSMSTSRL